MAKKTKSSSLRSAVEEFLKTTTLHGFKYLGTKHAFDRVGWLICCCASACCAGVLCAVLWARFQDMPALLALNDLYPAGDPVAYRMPLIAVCPPVDNFAEPLIDTLTRDKSLSKRLPITLSRLLDGKSVDHEQLFLLDGLLSEKNVSLPDLMYKYTPDCNQLMKKCRLQNKMVSCNLLFEKITTSWGICCVMQTNERIGDFSAGLLNDPLSIITLDLALQCADSPTVFGYEFYTKYKEEGFVEPVILTPGYTYIAHMSFTSITESSDAEKLVDGACVSSDDYTVISCLEKCAEKACGCRDILQHVFVADNDHLPFCNLTQLICLRSSTHQNKNTCSCLPPCTSVVRKVTLDSSRMEFDHYTFDPIYAGLNRTSIVVRFRLNIDHSTLFTIIPTETWLTLLSSLGGVFNMFLGVGLFSILEILVFLFVKLPIALRKTSNVSKVYPFQ